MYVKHHATAMDALIAHLESGVGNCFISFLQSLNERPKRGEELCRITAFNSLVFGGANHMCTTQQQPHTDNSKDEMWEEAVFAGLLRCRFPPHWAPSLPSAGPEEWCVGHTGILVQVSLSCSFLGFLGCVCVCSAAACFLGWVTLAAGLGMCMSIMLPSVYVNDTSPCVSFFFLPCAIFFKVMPVLCVCVCLSLCLCDTQWCL